jgi:hypothetical protein
MPTTGKLAVALSGAGVLPVTLCGSAMFFWERGGGVNIWRCGALRLELRLFVMLSAQVTFRGAGSV